MKIHEAISKDELTILAWFLIRIQCLAIFDDHKINKNAPTRNLNFLGIFNLYNNNVVSRHWCF